MQPKRSKKGEAEEKRTINRMRFGCPRTVAPHILLRRGGRDSSFVNTGEGRTVKFCHTVSHVTGSALFPSPPKKQIDFKCNWKCQARFAVYLYLLHYLSLALSLSHKLIFKWNSSTLNSTEGVNLPGGSIACTELPPWRMININMKLAQVDHKK